MKDKYQKQCEECGELFIGDESKLICNECLEYLDVLEDY